MPVMPAAIALPPSSGFIKRFCRNRTAMISLCILVLITLVAILAPYIAPHDPARSSLRAIMKPPSMQYLLGSDDLGRDVLSRLIFASRLSLVASVQAVVIALGIGLPLGLISGYVGGWVDTVIMRFNDALMSFPALILAVVIVGMMGPSLTNAMTAIGLVYAPRVMRVVRGSTLSVRQEVYITSARATGCGDARIILRHVLPNVMGPLVVQSTVLMGQALAGRSGIEFPGPGRAATRGKLGLDSRVRVPVHAAVASTDDRRRLGHFGHGALFQSGRRRNSRFGRPHAAGGRLTMDQGIVSSGSGGKLLEIRRSGRAVSVTVGMADGGRPRLAQCRAQRHRLHCGRVRVGQKRHRAGGGRPCAAKRRPDHVGQRALRRPGTGRHVEPAAQPDSRRRDRLHLPGADVAA